MTGRETEGAPGAVAQPLFATTHWSVVLAAANQESPEAAAALEQLCRTYWYPLYAYVQPVWRAAGSAAAGRPGRALNYLFFI